MQRALLALLLCTISGFALPNDVAQTGRTYDFHTVDHADITAKVLGYVNDNWIQIQNHNGTRLLNLQNVITVQEVAVKKSAH